MAAASLLTAACVAPEAQAQAPREAEKYSQGTITVAAPARYCLTAPQLFAGGAVTIAPCKKQNVRQQWRALHQVDSGLVLIAPAADLGLCVFISARGGFRATLEDCISEQSSAGPLDLVLLSGRATSPKAIWRIVLAGRLLLSGPGKLSSIKGSTPAKWAALNSGRSSSWRFDDGWHDPPQAV